MAVGQGVRMREQEDFNLEEAGAVQLVQELQIAGLCCMVVLPQDYESGLQRYPVLYVNGEIPIIEVMTELRKAGVSPGFIILSVKPDSWNDDFTPWSAPAFRKGETAPQGRAKDYIRRLTEEIKPYMDANYRTKPEPAYTALSGYSLGGLTALSSMYLTNCFGWICSLSGSLWYDGFCEFVEEERPLRQDVNVYLSLGKKERLSRNPRMGKVAECTEKVRQTLEAQLGRPQAEKTGKAGGQNGTDERGRVGEVCLEWNEGGHFHETAKRFVRAILWWNG